MVSDKIRIKKYQHEKVDHWCKVLGIPDSRLTEDAINFYLRYLESKQQLTLPTIAVPSAPLQETVELVETEDPSEYIGGINL